MVCTNMRHRVWQGKVVNMSDHYDARGIIFIISHNFPASEN